MSISSIKFKKILLDQFIELIRFDTKNMIEESTLALSEIPSSLTFEELLAAKDRGDQLFWIYTHENQLAGYCWIEERKNSLFLASLVISPKNRNKKIGRQILKKLDEIAIEKKISLCSLAVSALNYPAMHLYFSHGYQIVQCNPDYFGSVDPGKFRLLMEKQMGSTEFKYKNIEKIYIHCNDKVGIGKALANGFIGTEFSIKKKNQLEEGVLLFCRFQVMFQAPVGQAFEDNALSFKRLAVSR